MPIDPGPWEDGESYYDRTTSLETLRNNKFAVVDRTFNDMLTYAVGLGFTGAQGRDSVETLFRTYVSSWMAYLFIGEESIITDIQNDTTLPWLDTDVNGKTVRERLIERLQNG